jgi:chromosome segregation ATPase
MSGSPARSLSPLDDHHQDYNRRRDIRNLNAQVDSVRASLSFNDSIIQTSTELRLEAELEGIQRSHAELLQKYQRRGARIKDLKAKYQTAVATAEQLFANQEGIQSQLDQQRSAETRAQQSSQDMGSQISSLTDQLSQAQSENAHLSELNDSLSDRNKALLAKMKEGESFIQGFTNLKQENFQLRQKIDALTRQVQELAAASDEKDRRLEEANLEHAAALTECHNRLADASRTSTGIIGRYTGLVREIEGIQQVNSSLVKEKESLVLKIASLKAENSECQAQNSDLLAQLEDQRAELAQLRAFTASPGRGGGRVTKKSSRDSSSLDELNGSVHLDRGSRFDALPQDDDGEVSDGGSELSEYTEVRPRRKERDQTRQLNALQGQLDAMRNLNAQLTEENTHLKDLIALGEGGPSGSTIGVSSPHHRSDQGN